MTNKEKVLKYLLVQERDKTNPNRIYLGLNSYNSIKKLSKFDFASQLLLLEENKLIKCDFRGRADASAPCFVHLLDSGLNYFTRKKSSILKRIFTGFWDFIKFLIPTILSLISLLIAILAYLK